MKQEPSQSPIEAVHSSSYPALEGTEEMGGSLSQDDVIRRLFAPASNLPEPRNEQAIVVVSAGGTERVLTHSQIENLLAHGIEQLKARGVKECDKVVFCCENSPEFSSTILACWALNATAALIDFRAQRADVLAMSKKLGAKLLVTSKKLYTHFALETKLFTEEGLDVLDVSSFVDFKDAAPKSQFDIETLDLDRPAFAILTSGTTGTPKTSVHNLRSLALNIIDIADATNLQSNMTALTPLPISHIFGLSVLLVTQVLGVKTVLTELEPVGFVKAVHRHKPELIAALPQFYGALLSAPDGYINLTNASLLLCGGAPLTVSLADKFEEKFDKRLNNGYGSTESKIVALNKDGPTLSVGKPIGSVKIDIVNEQDVVLPDGKVGEVRITGSMLMDGYLNNEKETEKVLHNGRYYTGDIGRFEGGNLFVVGRKGDVIIVGGVVVQAAEVEEALRNYPEVKEVAVTAVQNKRLGQIVKASVVLMDDKIAAKLKSNNRNESLESQRQLQRQFRAFCKEHLSRYKRPMKWEFLGPDDNLPKTLAGKIDKKKMSRAKPN
jgi:acyl-CoA synthetase (AMP-forming)/AMP-acid ligase II